MNVLSSRWNLFFDRLFGYRINLHIIFWITFIAIFTAISSTSHDFLRSLLSTTLYALILSLPVTVNLVQLIPKYLFRRKYFAFAFLVIADVALFTPLLTAITYFNYKFIYDNLAELRQNYSLPELTIASAINISFLVGITTGLKFMSLWFSQQQKAREMEKQQLQSELTFLRSQINPHFLFNTLNNLYSLTLKKSDKAPEIVLKLSEMMRYMLYECNEKMVPLEKEINYVKSYIELEQLRKGEQTRITFNTQCQLNGQQIVPLLLIPFFENAFKHGLSNQIETGWVNIDLQVSGHYLELNIENSRPHINGSGNKEVHSGIGLKNVKRRLHLLYPEKHDLVISESHDIYSVNLKIELT